MARVSTAKKPQKRRTQAERREQTKAAILDTATRILAEEGFSKFSSSAVAAQAGVSRGALEHYYPKFIDLVAAACQHSMDTAVAEARAMAGEIEVTKDPIGNFLAASSSFFFAPGYVAQIEIMIAARSDPDLAAKVHPIILDARRTLDRIWTDSLSDWGLTPEQASQLVELSHYVLRGVFMAETWLPYDVARDKVLAEWRDLAERFFGADAATRA